MSSAGLLDELLALDSALLELGASLLELKILLELITLLELIAIELLLSGALDGVLLNMAALELEGARLELDGIWLELEEARLATDELAARLELLVVGSPVQALNVNAKVQIGR